MTTYTERPTLADGESRVLPGALGHDRGLRPRKAAFHQAVMDLCPEQDDTADVVAGVMVVDCARANLEDLTTRQRSALKRVITNMWWCASQHPERTRSERATLALAAFRRRRADLDMRP